MQSYKSYYMVSPPTVFTYPFRCAKLQILRHGVTANSLYLSFSPCKATNLTTWCHRKSVYKLLIIATNVIGYYTMFEIIFHIIIIPNFIQVLIDVLIPSTIQDIPEGLSLDILTFAKKLPVWLDSSLDQMNNELRLRKLKGNYHPRRVDAWWQQTHRSFSHCFWYLEHAQNYLNNWKWQVSLAASYCLP